MFRQNETISDAEARDVSLDYLRATLTLMVVAHHSCLAYADFVRRGTAWAAPVVDPTHSLIFDYAENFDDVFFMSLMFLLSGLFVWPSLRRHGALAFFGRRLLRLGLPFALGASLLMPLAYYAAWRAAGQTEGYLDYWRLNITQHGWPAGPLWFVWMLLLFDSLAAAVFASGLRLRLSPPRRPLPAFVAMLALCALAYLPMLAIFGFDRWATLLTPPLHFQASRMFLYLAWFGAGVWLGAGDLRNGLLARDGGLARRWRLWLAAAFVAYNLLIFAAPALGAAPAFWVVSCVVSSFAFLALFRGVVRKRRAFLDSLARSAYAIYLLHYAFVLWAQYAFLSAPLPAGVKFAAVFGAATLLSWLTAQALLKIPGADRVL